MTTDVRDTRSLPEEGFHEIQLSGKQLVFLFMATTVVCVVIFLAGVLVGRGVRGAEVADASRAELKPSPDTGAPETPAPAPSVAEATPAPDDAAAAGVPPTAEQAKPDKGGNAGKAAAKEKANEEAQQNAAALDYQDRLVNEQPPAENVNPRSQPATTAKSAASSLPPKPPPSAERAASEPVASAPAGAGILVQVTALRQRGEAEAIARRLMQKGYKAFVVGPQAGGTPFFRVRVGPFADKAEADGVVKRLTREEQFQPWIVR